MKLEPFYFVKRHALGMIVALAIVFVVSLLNPSPDQAPCFFLVCGGILLMAATFLQGIERNGAARWLISEACSCSRPIRQAGVRGAVRVAVVGKRQEAGHACP